MAKYGRSHHAQQMSLLVGTDGTIAGTDFNDVIFGTDLSESIWSGQGIDEIHGGGGDDYLEGGVGNDALFGDDGNDVLVGFAGADTLTGGTGADTFKLNEEAWLFQNDGWHWSPDRDGERDTITDFNSAEGDKIDLSGDALLHYIDTDGDQRSEVYPVTWADVEILTLGADQYRVVVHQVAGDPQWDLSIDVLGAAPVEADFVF